MNNDLISRSALLEWLCEGCNGFKKIGCDTPCYAYDLISEAPAVDAAPKWISVEERLPEDDGHYLCYTTDGYCNFCVYYGDGEWMILDQEDLAQKVTHWMLLPEPPMEGRYMEQED